MSTIEHASEFTFRMNDQESPLAQKYPGFVGELTTYVNASAAVTNNDQYSAFLKGVTDLVVKHKKELTQATPMFDKEIRPVGSNELTIKTPWGGVSFKEVSVAKNHVEK